MRKTGYSNGKAEFATVANLLWAVRLNWSGSKLRQPPVDGSKVSPDEPERVLRELINIAVILLST